MRIITSILLLSTFFGFSQSLKLPSDFKFVEINSSNYESKETWLNVYGDFFIVYFDQNPVGIKHLYENLMKILKANDLDINNPFLDKSLIPSYVDSLEDFGRLNTAIQVSDAEIEKAWVDGRGGRVFIRLNKTEYSISLK